MICTPNAATILSEILSLAEGGVYIEWCVLPSTFGRLVYAWKPGSTDVTVFVLLERGKLFLTESLHLDEGMNPIDEGMNPTLQTIQHLIHEHQRILKDFL